jgi:hypothetical protein
MGEWRVQISVRVSQEVRADLEKYAAREKRTLANFGAVLLEWSFEQLKAVGSTEQLLKQNVRPASEHRK